MPRKKFQFVVDALTERLIGEITEWTKVDNVSELMRYGIKDLHWRLSEHRNGRQVVSRPVESGTTVFDSLIPVKGKVG